MWERTLVDNDNIMDEYQNIIKKAAKKKDSILHLYIQVFFSLVIIVTSFMFKNGNIDSFSYIKENYDYFFETDTYRESTFSYVSFINKMDSEMRIRFNQLMEVVNSKGSTGEFPANVSNKKYFISKKGIKPAEGYISSPYGIRKNPFDPKEKEFHTGLDIAAVKGTFIRSAFDGVVIDVSTSKTAGNYIKISSEDNIMTLYAHNQFILVNVGDKVIAGQIIATMGDTGLATGTHLHFEFISDGIRYNPVYVLDI
ncbi:MAG: M23 family metallopeptidase [Oscillospiraceae bacterium]|nr:M23 family metallopeptidase [Oscillospiraceae bacterium]